MFEKTIIQRATVTAMVNAYKQSCEDIDQAYKLLKSAQIRMDTTIGDGFGNGYRYSTTCIPYGSSAEKTKMELRKTSWRAILNRLEIEKVMSIKDLEKFRKSFDDESQIPELEVATVLDISYGLVQSASEYAKRLVEEVYEILMPGTRESNTHKTNLKNARRALGKKVILTWMVECSWSGSAFNVNHHSGSEDKLIAVDKVFFTLDGKGIPTGYRSPLVDAINTVGKSGVGETEYFKFWCYKNQNLHLEFKRLDLVSRLNQIAGAHDRIAD